MYIYIYTTTLINVCITEKTQCKSKIIHVTINKCEKKFDVQNVCGLLYRRLMFCFTFLN